MSEAPPSEGSEHPEGIEHEESFCIEIPSSELQIHRKIGHGAYGVVKEGLWNDKRVAIKFIENEKEKQAFVDEMRQLSKVKHVNIVELYGACTLDALCLVMEFAEDGSLYDLLHGTRKPRYTAGHAVSWVLQCAKGVEHLHELGLVHRDLKPPNLLLRNSCRELKICDFGTVCDLKTYMTNNKGSAAWMAPEVFEGVKYTERCDAFSWAIILWEVLTRRRPFEEVGGGAFRIMWAVHQGSRPPLISGCPKPLEIIMTEAWDAAPAKRPTFAAIVQRMSTISQFFPGRDEPISLRWDAEREGDDLELSEGSSASLTLSEDGRTLGDTLEPEYDTSTLGESMGELVPLVSVPPPRSPNVVEEEPQPSALAASRDLGKSLSCLSNQPSTSTGPDKEPFVKGHKRTGSHPLVPLAEAGRSAPRMSVDASVGSGDGGGVSAGAFLAPWPNYYAMLEPGLQPLPPDPNSQESLYVYNQHCRMADEYIRMREEIALLQKSKHALLTGLEDSLGTESEPDCYRLQTDYESMVLERDKLLELKKKLQLQITP